MLFDRYGTAPLSAAPLSLSLPTPLSSPSPRPQLYQASLLRAVKKTAGEGLFPVFFVDSPHYSRRDLEDVWGAAKRAGFEAYVVDLFHVGLQVRSAPLFSLLFHRLTN